MAVVHLSMWWNGPFVGILFSVSKNSNEIIEDCVNKVKKEKNLYENKMCQLRLVS